MGITIAVLFTIAVGIFLYRSNTNKNTPSGYTQSDSSKLSGSVSKRVRLTNQQMITLSVASLDKPIYGENPSLIHAQMPNDAACFNLRTIESLTKRGYLKSDGKGGYLLTPEGMDGLRSSMGF